MNYNQHQQISQSTPVDQSYQRFPQPRIGRRRRAKWPWILLLAAIGVALAVFLYFVYNEVSGRDAALRGFLDSARQQSPDSAIGSQLLSGLSGKVIAASSTTDLPSTSTLSADNSIAKDSNRQLAEKPGRPQTGNVSSSLVIVEFADFQCPICEQEFPIFRAVSNKYAKDALFIFRNFPVIDDNSTALAQAGLCAQEQGKFWTFHDRMYSNQAQLANIDDFKSLAVMSGLNWTKLQDCITKEKFKPLLLEDMSDAVDLGVRGTPTFFINGKKLEGAVTEATWDDIFAKYKELNNIK